MYPCADGSAVAATAPAPVAGSAVAVAAVDTEFSAGCGGGPAGRGGFERGVGPPCGGGGDA